MSIWFWTIGIFVILGILKFVLDSDLVPAKEGKRGKYTYGRKKFLLTKPEHEFYDILMDIVGDMHRVFVQVPLRSLVDHTVARQNWKGALGHINQKSIDFVICDKESISPIFAIELDDSSHNRADRQKRDGDVEYMV